MRTISLINNLFLIFSLLQGSGISRNAAIPSRLPETRLEEIEVPPRPGRCERFPGSSHRSDDPVQGRQRPGSERAQRRGRRIPYLVLSRNGIPTPNSERTLHISLDNLQIPSSGLYASLEIETEHGDPDLGRDSQARIRVWDEKRFISSPADPQASQSVDFTVTFQRLFEHQGKENSYADRLLPLPGEFIGCQREASANF